MKIPVEAVDDTEANEAPAAEAAENQVEDSNKEATMTEDEMVEAAIRAGEEAADNDFKLKFEQAQKELADVRNELDAAAEAQKAAEDNRNKPLYMISVAAELTGMHPQTLRVYESKGLVNPQRSGGNTRLYSRADIERLELINQLTDEGINLAGVVRILDMKERAEERERENEKLRARVRQLEDELHEYKMQKKITALAPRDGSVNPEQVMRKLLGAGGDL